MKIEGTSLEKLLTMPNAKTAIDETKQNAKNANQPYLEGQKISCLFGFVVIMSDNRISLFHYVLLFVISYVTKIFTLY